MPLIICGPWWLVIPIVLVWLLWKYTEPRNRKRK
jgi:hypothetical protein